MGIDTVRVGKWKDKDHGNVGGLDRLYCGGSKGEVFHAAGGQRFVSYENIDSRVT